MLQKELLTTFTNLERKPDTQKLISLNNELDIFFGITDATIESSDDDHYPDLDPNALNTSYLDYYKILKSLPKGEVLIDLGAGAGRGSMLCVFLDLPRCVSFEFERARVDRLKRALEVYKERDLALQGDLADLDFPEQSYYYLYFPKNRIFYHVLRELMRREALVYICESHGDMLPFLSLFKSNLKQLSELSASMPRLSQKIPLFKLSPIPPAVSIEDSLALWFLKNFDSNKIIVFKWKSSQLIGESLLYIPVMSCDLIHHGNKLAIKNRVSNRVYILGREVEIDKTLVLNDELSFLKPLFDLGLKVFSRSSRFYVEQKSGVVERAEYQSHPDTYPNGKSID